MIWFSWIVLWLVPLLAQAGVTRECDPLDLACHEPAEDVKNCTGLSDEVNCTRSKRQSQPETPPATEVCILPPYPSRGKYEVLNVPNVIPGQSLESFVLSVSCQHGYGFPQSEGGGTNTTLLVYCVQGRWFHSMPRCVKYCKLNSDPSIRYMCQVPGTIALTPCERLVPPGAAVKPICNSPFYYSSENQLNMHCLSGRWDYEAQCKAECGRITPEGVHLITGGVKAKRGELPWHVGIYRTTYAPFMQICGGSIISNNVVISAAHCFWNEAIKRLPAENYAVAAGKLYRPWDDPVDVDAQKSEVKEIRMPFLFEGAAANFQEDIAILILITPLVYKTYVRPVCLNFDSNFDRWQLRHGNMGKVAGWGLTSANGPSSPVLKVIDIPYINVGTCIDSFPPSFREYITGDKFCAGYMNGAALCRGDSGGGLTFPDKELGIDRYYLRGIVSAAPNDGETLCNVNTFITFTKITKHEDFIKEFVDFSSIPFSNYTLRLPSDLTIHED